MIPEEWQDIIEEYRQRMADARAMGGEEKLAKHRAGGQRNDARQRIEKLCDPGSFKEIGTLVGGLSWDGLPVVPADGIVTGFGTINGKPVAVASEDFTAKGASIGHGAHAKRLRLASVALQERIPMVLMLEGAGERMSNALQRHPYAPNDLQILAQLAGQVPVVAIILGPSAGHSALSGMFADLIVMVEGSALFSAGPPLVLQSLGERADVEALGGARMHTQHSGVAHNRVDTEADAFELARDFLGYHPLNAWQRPPLATHLDNSAEGNSEAEDSGPRLVPDIYKVMPRSANVPYEIRNVIRLLVDAGKFLEVQPDYANNIVVGLARLGGAPVAFVANQPNVKAGTIDQAAARKATRFFEAVDNFHFPMIFFVDNPGVLPGTVSERDGVLLAAANMYKAQSRLRSPKIHVTLRKAFGFGSSLMAMNPYDRQTISYALPGITLGGLPADGGAQAANMDEETKKQMREMQSRASWGASDTMAYDEIVDPVELRNYLLLGLQISQGRNTLNPGPK